MADLRLGNLDMQNNPCQFAFDYRCLTFPQYKLSHQLCTMRAKILFSPEYIYAKPPGITR